MLSRNNLLSRSQDSNYHFLFLTIYRLNIFPWKNFLFLFSQKHSHIYLLIVFFFFFKSMNSFSWIVVPCKHVYVYPCIFLNTIFPGCLMLFVCMRSGLAIWRWITNGVFFIGDYFSWAYHSLFVNNNLCRTGASGISTLQIGICIVSVLVQLLYVYPAMLLGLYEYSCWRY